MKTTLFVHLTTLLSLGLCLHVTETFSQGSITIDPTVKRFVGNESDFIREKYLTFHSWFKKEDTDFEQFKVLYNISSNYNGSRLFNNPGGRHKNGKFPKIKNQYTGVRAVSDVVSTGSPKLLFHDKTVDYSVTDISEFSKKSAAFTAEFFSHQADIVPKYFEPLNEPMVHAREFLGTQRKMKNKQQKVNIVVEKIIDYHAEVFAAIKSKPELKLMKVGGFGSAFPEFEANNFGLWNNRFKKFIDRLGTELDFLALHLYDGSGINNKTGKRSGSNAEAILDMLEAYSHLKTGNTIPFAITEYGRLVPDQPNYRQNGNYVPLVNAQAVRSQLHLVMNFIERGDNVLLATPFTVGKQRPKSRYSKSSLWTQQHDGTYELSQRKYFFEIWKEVRGHRVLLQSSNVDVQSQAFVDNHRVFVVLNNLNNQKQEVALELINTNKIKEVEIKRLNIFNEKLPELTIHKHKKAPEKLRLNYGETVVLKYTFKKPIKHQREVRSRKYYAEAYLKAIEPNSSLTFSIKGVPNQLESTTLRLGVARDHGASLTPEIKINGEGIPYVGDVIRGGDQKVRKRFFGVLEIPVPTDVIKAGVNSISVTFPDDGGHVSSVIIDATEKIH